MNETEEIERRMYDMLEGRLDRLEQSQTSQGVLLAAIEANTRPLPELHKRLRDVEKSTSNIWVILRLAGTAILALLGAGSWLWARH